jgi:hypothetical protein
MKGFRNYCEMFDNGGPQERTPVSARIRRRIEIPAMKHSQFYKDLYPGQAVDKPASAPEFEPTHVSLKIPNLEIMVLSRKNGLVKYILSYGGTGGEPEQTFAQNWKSILSPGQN